ncbi:hypothetical protein [Mycolicibacterium senegalense]|uniref:hypothetical protein n=1 Tax=Mycolicibacterium senegalense TaxID=1796 RepID=UPI0036434F5A
MSPAIAAAPLPTKSGIENWDTSYLDAAASTWRNAATASEGAFDQHRRNIDAPGGTTWTGDAKDAALDRVTNDIGVVGRQSGVLREAAGLAENGAYDIKAAKDKALQAITAAVDDGFSVDEDLSVTDGRRYDINTVVDRNRAAAEHAEDIRWAVQQLVQADQLVGNRLEAKAADLEGIRFEGEGEGQGGTSSHVQLVDNKVQDKPSDDRKGEKPGPAEHATGQVGPFAVPKSVEDAAKKSGLKPDEKPPGPATDDGGLGDLLGANDHPAAKPEDVHADKPGEEKPPVLPHALSQLPKPPEPGAIDRQAAKVEAARQALNSAQAKMDVAAGQNVVQGAGAGPSRSDTDSLSQAVFDARAELTEQTRVLNELNYASAATGGPTAPVEPLPENANVQAFPPPPSEAAKAAEGLSQFSHDLNKVSLGMVPDVAQDIETYSNWGQASGEERTQAVLDSAGLVPLPFGKPLFEGLEHGLDLFSGGAHHLDDLPIHADAPSAPHSHVDAPDVPSDTPIPVEHGPAGDPGGGNLPHIEVNMKEGWSDFQQSQMQDKIDRFNSTIDDQGFNQVPPVPRDPAVRQEFLNSLGLDRVPPGFHVDHTRDLQAGGLDAVENMGLLEGSVNTSFGSQLNKGMNQFPPGTAFGGVRLPDP